MKLKELINNREEKFFVLMGFTNSELLDLPNKLLDLPISNGVNKYIYNPNETFTSDLFTQFFNIDQKSWLTYEEFFLLRGFIESAIKKEDIIFIYNNKYLGLYPFNYSFDGIENFYENLYSSHNSDFKANDIEEKVTELYTNIKKINDEYYIAYNTQLFEDYSIINLYTNEKELESLNEIDNDKYDYSFDYN
ncbi:hypothetical protein BUZ63_12230, partial [Staphylococcus pasteuri]